MPQVQLKLTRWLCHTLNVEPPKTGHVDVSVFEGESIPAMIRRLALEEGDPWKKIYNEKTDEIGPHVVVILNGCIVNASNRHEVVLKEGDELMFLPAFEGG